MRCILLLLLLSAAPQLVYAQVDSTVAQPDEKIMFQSKVRQLTSYLNEGNTSAANTLFKDVADAMDVFIKQTKAGIDTASGTEKRKQKEKLDNQRQLAAQFHSFRADLIRNRSSIDAWTQQFIKTLY